MQMDEELAKKIGLTVKEVSDLRGLAITKAVDIELMVDAIIRNFFIPREKPSNFTKIVLSDPYFSFGLKINILKKILNKIEWVSYKGFKEDLYKIEQLRNRFAHSGMFGFDGELIYENEGKHMENKKAKEMFDEFILLRSKVMEELHKIFEHVIKI